MGEDYVGLIIQSVILSFSSAAFRLILAPGRACRPNVKNPNRACVFPIKAQPESTKVFRP